MKLAFWWLGKTNEKYLTEGISIYSKRIKHYTTCEIKEIKDPKAISNKIGSDQARPKIEIPIGKPSIECEPNMLMAPKINHVRYGISDNAIIGYEYHALSYIVQYAERLRIYLTLPLIS